jgi:hypothetical protein
MKNMQNRHKHCHMDTHTATGTCGVFHRSDNVEAQQRACKPMRQILASEKHCFTYKQLLALFGQTQAIIRNAAAV